MELEESTFLTSDYTTKLESLRQYGSGTKIDIQTNGTRQKVQRFIHTPMGTLFFTNKATIHNGAKITSSIKGAGKTGQLHVKE